LRWKVCGSSYPVCSENLQAPELGIAGSNPAHALPIAPHAPAAGKGAGKKCVRNQLEKKWPQRLH